MNFSNSNKADNGLSASSVVTQDLTVEYDDAQHRTRSLRVQMAYRVDDPYAVAVTIFATRGVVTWTFARELLALGTTEPVGMGDVQVWPCLDETGRAVVIIELSSPDGELALQARTADVQRFVDQTLVRVPLGTESRFVDLDDLVGHLLAGA